MNDESKSSNSSRSDGEPETVRSTTPIWIILLTLMLLFLGSVYFDHHSGWFSSKVYSPYTSKDEVELYQPKSGAAAQAAHGRQVYQFVCGACHGVDGMGKPGQAPPLAGSEWVNANGFHRLAQILLNGLNGNLQVEGKDWNLNMAAMGAGLSDADLAAVLTYIRTSWDNKAGAVTADDVKAIRAAVGGHPSISAAQLKTIPE
ncbi:MAG: cytochrome c [Verrucomicrobiota bacterium]|jgi:mono/diheme cytochrome c family protein